jgi:hypothetical protein
MRREKETKCQGENSDKKNEISTKKKPQLQRGDGLVGMQLQPMRTHRSWRYFIAIVTGTVKGN